MRSAVASATVFIVGSLLAASAIAQTVSPASLTGYAKKEMDTYTKVLNLTPDQQEKVAPLFHEEAEQVKAVKEDATLSKEQKTSRMQSIKTDLSNKLKSYLNPEQVTKLMN
jgi:hypothetical protein